MQVLERDDSVAKKGRAMNAKGNEMPTEYATILKGRTYKEGEYWIAECTELPLAGFGKTPELAFKSLLSCLSSYIEAAVKLGDLDEVITQHGLLQKAVTPSESGVAWNMPLIKDRRLAPV